MRNYCPHCGSPWSPAGATCSHCGLDWWANPVPSVAGILRRGGNVLLLQRARSPYRLHWDLPGGFCDAGETPKETVRREFLEETGIEVSAGRVFGVWPDVYEDPACVEPLRHTLNLVYEVHADAAADLRLLASDEGEARWWPVDRLPAEIAFPASTGRALGELVTSSGNPPVL